MNVEKATKHNYGIDVLRIISMFSIVGLHVLGQGGVLFNMQLGTLNSCILQILYVFFICSVDTFAMITGYLYANKEKVKSRNVIDLFFTVAFYCVVITLIVYILVPEIFDRKWVVISALFPPIVDKYWYIVCYFLVFFFIPYLNKLIAVLEKRNFQVLLGILLLFLSLVTTFGYKDYFRTDSGYSPWWLIVCYLIGAYIKMYGLPKFLLQKQKLLLVCNILTVYVGWNILEWLNRAFLGINIETRLFLRYTSPFTVLSAVLLLSIMIEAGERLENVRFKKIIGVLSKSAFGVYIIHSHILIFDYFMAGRFAFILELSPIMSFIAVILSCCGIYSVCTIVDVVRQNIFKTKGVSNFINKLGERIDRVLL